MASSSVGVRRSVEAEINYVRNPPPPGAPKLEFVPAAEERNTMVTLPGQLVRITDARGWDTDLDRQGFLLMAHRSNVTDFHQIQVDPAADRLALDESAALLTELTGASLVLAMSAKKRYGESATDRLASLPNAKPARYPHADNTDESGASLARFLGEVMGGIDVARYARVAMYNVWRAFSPPPQDFPLAVCDGLTTSAADEVTVTAITEELAGAGTRQIVHDTIGYLYNPAHRWYYYPDMTVDEVIVFKSHDSDPTRTGRIPHSAFTDPTCPAGVPTRASVEVRALALFD